MLPALGAAGVEDDELEDEAFLLFLEGGDRGRTSEFRAEAEERFFFDDEEEEEAAAEAAARRDLDMLEGWKGKDAAVRQDRDQLREGLLYELWEVRARGRDKSK